jgi:dUTPase
MFTSLRIQFCMSNSDCLPPAKSRHGKGYDLFMPADVHILPGEECSVDLGVFCRLPPNVTASVLLNSGFARATKLVLVPVILGK